MSRLDKILTAVGAGVLIFLTLGAWSLASPVGAAPDDDFHLASIWCGNGERDGLCALGSAENRRLVPDKAVNAVCYAYDAKKSPSCQGPDFQGRGYDLVETDRVNSGSQYPSGFYFWTSFLASDNIAVSTILIRLANSALFAALIVVSWTLLPRRFRFALAGSVALTFVPLGIFTIASVNPSSWALTSGALILPTLLGYFATRGWRRVLLGALASFAALLSFSARGDSAAFTAVAVLAAVVLCFRPERNYWKLVVLPAVLLIGAITTFLSAGQTGLALEGALSTHESTGTPPKSTLAISNLLSLPNLWNGVFGQNWGLGWLDTTMPAIVSGAVIFLFTGTLFVSLRWTDWRRGIALTGVGAAAIVVPTYILVQAGALVGTEVQPRYIMPLITMFLAVALAPTAAKDVHTKTDFMLSPLQLWLIAIGLSGAHGIALFVNLRRYLTGIDYAGLNLNSNVEWWWQYGPSPVAVFAIGTISFAGFMALFAIASGQMMKRTARNGSDQVGVTAGSSRDV